MFISSYCSSLTCLFNTNLDIVSYLCVFSISLRKLFARNFIGLVTTYSCLSPECDKLYKYMIDYCFVPFSLYVPLMYSASKLSTSYIFFTVALIGKKEEFTLISKSLT